MKIKLRAPDVNDSEMDFGIKYPDDVNGENSEGGEILYGLSAIKNVGEKAWQRNIISEES
ncbi:MAG: hypothetical protein R3A12_03145 [Ignavibacteria bacterium]